MEKNEILKLKKRLEDEQRELEKILSRLHHDQETTDVLSEDEIADIYEEIDLEETLEENLKKRLKVVNEALKRINENTYGVCVKCNQPIEKDRLELDPATIYCSQCI